MKRILTASLASCGLLAAVTLASPQSISERIDLAGDAVIGAATGDQSTPSAARGGDWTLVVWADRRGSLSTNTAATFSAESELDIFATRLDPSGMPLESVPIAVALGGGNQLRPKVAWNGTNWLVAWVSEVPSAGWYTHAVQGLRIASSGALLDAAPIEILQWASSDITSLAIASDGSDWLVAAQGSSVGGLWGARVSAGGSLLDAVPVLLDAQPSLVGGLALSGAQGRYLLVWSDTTSNGGWEIFGRRYDSDLSALDATRFAIGATAQNDVFPSAATNGRDFLVAWERYQGSTFEADVRAARVRADGTVLDPSSLDLSGNLPFGNALGAAAAWDGSQWYVSWVYGGLSLTRLSSSGSVLDYGGFALDGGHTGMSQAVLSGAPAGGALATWVDARQGSYEGLDLYARYALNATNQGAEHIVSRGAPAQLDLDFAEGGSGFLAVYRSETSGARRILAARLDPQGHPLDSQPIEVVSGLFELAPAVAWNGSEFLIVWEHATSVSANNTIWGTRMASDGSLLDAPFVILEGLAPEVAALGGNFLVVATDGPVNPELRFPVGVRVRGSDGALLGSPFVINSSYAQAADVCALGERWAMVWQRNASHNNPWADVAAAFIEADGTAGAPFYVGDPTSTYNYAPRIASAGDQALIVWTGYPYTSLARKVFARRLTAAGSFADAQGVVIAASAPGQRFAPAVAWSGSEYFVAFQDQRHVNFALIDERSDVCAARVRSDGTLLDPAGFAIEASAFSEARPALVGNGAGLCIVGTSSFRPASDQAAYRIGLRRVSGDCTPPEVYCNALQSSNGCLPSLSASGTASLSHPAAFVISANNLEVGQFGLLFFSTTGRANVPFFGGTRCVATPLLRMGVKNSGGSGACTGAMSYSLAELLAHPQGGALLQPGVLVNCQAWFRDPPATFGVGLTDGIEFTICP